MHDARGLRGQYRRLLRAWNDWPPVGRADNVYGDRNLMCGCAPISAYE